jgi:hypothetical protein
LVLVKYDPKQLSAMPKKGYYSLTIRDETAKKLQALASSRNLSLVEFFDVLASTLESETLLDSAKRRTESHLFEDVLRLTGEIDDWTQTLINSGLGTRYALRIRLSDVPRILRIVRLEFARRFPSEYAAFEISSALDLHLKANERVEKRGPRLQATTLERLREDTRQLLNAAERLEERSREGPTIERLVPGITVLAGEIEDDVQALSVSRPVTHARPREQSPLL